MKTVIAIRDLIIFTIILPLATSVILDKMWLSKRREMEEVFQLKVTPFTLNLLKEKKSCKKDESEKACLFGISDSMRVNFYYDTRDNGILEMPINDEILPITLNNNLKTFILENFTYSSKAKCLASSDTTIRKVALQGYTLLIKYSSKKDAEEFRNSIKGNLDIGTSTAEIQSLQCDTAESIIQKITVDGPIRLTKPVPVRERQLSLGIFLLAFFLGIAILYRKYFWQKK